MDTYSIFVLIHLIGVAVGFGSALVGDYLFMISLSDDHRIDEKEFKILKATGKLVWVGIVILISSGFMLFYMSDFAPLAQARVLAKMTLVGIVIVNGLLFHLVHLPFLKDYFKNTTLPKTTSKIKSRFSFIFISGAISMVSWFSIIILASWRTLSYSYTTIIGFYLLIVFLVSLVALLLKRYEFPNLSKGDKFNMKSINKKYIVYVLIALFIFIIGSLIVNKINGNNFNENKTQSIIKLTPKMKLKNADQDEIHISYVPNVPPAITRKDQRIIDIDLEVIQNVCTIDEATNTKFEVWGYRVAGDSKVTCGSPGPVLRGRVGDVMRVTLTSVEENTHPHNIDFHAAIGPGGGAKGLTVSPGESATIEFRLMYPGAFQYHCAFGNVPEHISRGQYGILIVDPEKPLPKVDHEWAVMQSEWYTGQPNKDGISNTDFEKLLAEDPKFVTFNGTTNSLKDDRVLKMNVGERSRIYFINHGLSLNSNFHAIGSHWDVVYPEGATDPRNRIIYGSQSTLVVTGGGVIVEMLAKVPGDVLLVDHALSRTFYKGALGIVRISGNEDPEIFEVTKHASETAGPNPYAVNTEHSTDNTQNMHMNEDTKVFNIDASDFKYSQKEIRVKKGDKVKIILNVVQGFHDLSIPEYNVKTKRMKAGSQETIEFIADKQGSFEYFCTLEGHKAMGQFGKLIVE